MITFINRGVRTLRSALLLIAALWAGAGLTPAVAQEQLEARFSAAQREQMLAPIALYPDSLLTHILIAATYPLEVVQARRLQLAEPNLSAEQLTSSPQAQQWDPSVVALLGFPTVLEKMSDELAWTQQLGDAFLQDEAALLASVQSLRQQAYEAETLAQVEHLNVTKVNQQIVIQAADPQVIYVPYYDPRVVYGHWHWVHYPPVYWAPPAYYYPPYYGHFAWHVGIRISFNYFFSAFHWGHHHHHLVVVHHRHSHRYRPHHKIAVSHGAKRWHHQVKHRRGVSYRSHHVAKRYGSQRPSVHRSYDRHRGVPQATIERHHRQRVGEVQRQLKQQPVQQPMQQSKPNLRGRDKQHQPRHQQRHADAATIGGKRPQPSIGQPQNDRDRSFTSPRQAQQAKVSSRERAKRELRERRAQQTRQSPSLQPRSRQHKPQGDRPKQYRSQKSDRHRSPPQRERRQPRRNE